jgi:hypothetical protein
VFFKLIERIYCIIWLQIMKIKKLSFIRKRFLRKNISINLQNKNRKKMEFSWRKKIEKEEKSCPAGFPKPPPVHRFHRFGTVQSGFSGFLGGSHI